MAEFFLCLLYYVFGLLLGAALTFLSFGFREWLKRKVEEQEERK